MSYPSQQRDPGLWLGLSIGATVLCCLPLGIPGIVYAAMAMSAQGRGDYAQASEYTAKARNWTYWSIGVGIAVIVIYVCVIATQFRS